MIPRRSRGPLAILAIAASMLCTARLHAHDAPGAHDETAPARAAREMAQAAGNLWVALTPEQQKKAGFDFESAQRFDWHFVPRPRQGLPWKEMTPSQSALAHALLASGLSQRGYVKAETIMSLEQVLHEIEQGKGAARDAGLYFFTIFGDPGSKDARKPWGWRVEGHHLALNFTIAGDSGSAAGPTFMGSNPAEVRSGPRKGLRVLGVEEDLARQLVKSLDEGQKKKAILSPDAPKDILSFNARSAKPLKPDGLTAGEMTSGQKEQLTRLIASYAERLRPELSAQDLAKVLKAGIDRVGFAWAGDVEPGRPHYYRVQGPTFLLEYDNTQNNANHVHSVWRDFENDFGEDLLRRHYETHPHGDKAR